MKKYITLLGLVLAVSSSIAADPAITLDSLKAKLTPAQRESVDSTAIYDEARRNPEFYKSLKAANWTFEGITLQEYQWVNAANINKDYAVINGEQAVRILAVPAYKTWVASLVGEKGETLAAYDWLQAQRLIAVGSSASTSAEKVEFLDALSAQILAAAKAKQ